MNVFFEKAVPVWVTGREKEMNLRVQFKAVFGKGKNIIAKIATSGIYHMSVNGKFVCYGPARAGRGFFRVDEIDLTPFADQEQNTVIIEVCGYNARSYYLIKQDSFLTAELSADGRVEAYTGNNFTARINPEYIKKIQRYSFQRPFAESYRIIEGDTYFTDAVQGTEPLSYLPQPKYLKRSTPYPLYEKTGAKRILGGTFSFSERDEYWRNGAFDALVAKPEQSEYLFNDPDLMITEECEKLQLSAPVSNEDKALSDGIYSMMPFVIFTPVYTAMSYVLSQNEAGFYNALQAFMWIWIIVLLVLCVNMLNNYSFGKTIGVCIISLLVMALIWAIGFLFIAIVSEVWKFVSEIGTELRMLV